MSRNQNSWIPSILSWHGHDQGGVHVPFQQQSNPLGATIETQLIQRLRVLASNIASGDTSAPRWIFLIGGPGNGKSETVQDFLVQLDSALQMEGSLVDVLIRAFAPNPVTPRSVTINTEDVATCPGSFREHIGRLTIVQDATASDAPLGNAALELANNIADLLTSSENPPPVFIACANRGLLVGALREAYQEWPEEDVTGLLSELIRASSLGVEALGREALSCWPLEKNRRFACWPLDVESILIAKDGISPIEQILLAAVDEDKWEIQGQCFDCDARSLCPLRQNAVLLREKDNRESLLHILRHGELATGQRWNFRDAFSLVAELIVGQWNDFGDYNHPCDWVHGQLDRITAAMSQADTLEQYYVLLRRLYPQALFPSSPISSANLSLAGVRGAQPTITS